MQLFKRKVTKLEERIQVLEQTLGLLHIYEYNSSDYEERQYGFIPQLKNSIKKLEQKEK